PALAAPVALLKDILPPLYEEPAREQPPTLDPAQASAKLAGGVPLLRGEAVSLDARSFRRRWQAVCSALQRHQDPAPARALEEALRRGTLVPDELLREALSDQPEGLHARAERLGLDPALTATVLRLASFPALAHLGLALDPLREGQPW